MLSAHLMIAFYFQVEEHLVEKHSNLASDLISSEVIQQQQMGGGSIHKTLFQGGEGF